MRNFSHFSIKYFLQHVLTLSIMRKKKAKERGLLSGVRSRTQISYLLALSMWETLEWIKLKKCMSTSLFSQCSYERYPIRQRYAFISPRCEHAIKIFNEMKSRSTEQQRAAVLIFFQKERDDSVTENSLLCFRWQDFDLKERKWKWEDIHHFWNIIHIEIDRSEATNREEHLSAW